MPKNMATPEGRGEWGAGKIKDRMKIKIKMGGPWI